MTIGELLAVLLVSYVIILIIIKYIKWSQDKDIESLQKELEELKQINRGLVLFLKETNLSWDIVSSLLKSEVLLKRRNHIEISREAINSYKLECATNNDFPYDSSFFTSYYGCKISVSDKLKGYEINVIN